MLNCWIKKKILKEIRYDKTLYLQYIKLFSLSIYLVPRVGFEPTRF